MENKKITFVTILILLVFFLPITIFSCVQHYQQVHPVIENPNQEFHFEGKLYFYQANELLGTYTCQNANGYCDYATASNKVGEYALKERQDTSNDFLPIIDNNFVFLKDTSLDNQSTAPILLYDIQNKRVINSFNEVKNYGIGINDDIYLVKNKENLWGALKFSGEMARIFIPFQYDYIGLVNNVDEETNKIVSNQFAVLNNNTWQIIDEYGNEITSVVDKELITFQDNYLVVKENNLESLINVEGQTILSNFNSIDFYDSLVQIIDVSNRFYLYNLKQKTRISEFYPIDSIEDIELNSDDENIEIYYKGELAEKVAIP